VYRCQAEILPSLPYFPVEIADDVMINDVENCPVRTCLKEQERVKTVLSKEENWLCAHESEISSKSFKFQCRF
jgi:hypothetical protein